EPRLPLRGDHRHRRLTPRNPAGDTARPDRPFGPWPSEPRPVGFRPFSHVTAGAPSRTDRASVSESDRAPGPRRPGSPGPRATRHGLLTGSPSRGRWPLAPAEGPVDGSFRAAAGQPADLGRDGGGRGFEARRPRALGLPGLLGGRAGRQAGGPGAGPL